MRLHTAVLKAVSENKNGFRFQHHFKTLFHIGHYRLRQHSDFLAGCASEVYQYQCLLLVTPGAAHGFSFPAAAVDEPARRKLESAVRLRIAWHVGVLFT